MYNKTGEEGWEGDGGGGGGGGVQDGRGECLLAVVEAEEDVCSSGSSRGCAVPCRAAAGTRPWPAPALSSPVTETVAARGSCNTRFADEAGQAGGKHENIVELVVSREVTLLPWRCQSVKSWCDDRSVKETTAV